MTSLNRLWRSGTWKVWAIIGSMSFILPASVSAQHIKTSFNFSLETLPLAQQEDMRDFNRNLQLYTESWDWLDEDLPEPVKLYMEGPLAYRGSVVKTQYASKLTVSNGLDIKYVDRWWFFEFERGDLLRHDERRFHPLTWLIDYYVQIMLGHELDKFSEFGGEEHFKRAQAICNDGRFSSEYQRGWDERLALIESIRSEDYKPYRRLRLLFYQSMLRQKDNNTEAKLLCKQAVGILESLHARNRKDENVKKFMSAHYIELADVFKTETTPDIYQTLIKIDPNNTDKYNEYIAGLGRK